MDQLFCEDIAATLYIRSQNFLLRVTKKSKQVSHSAPCRSTLPSHRESKLQEHCPLGVAITWTLTITKTLPLSKVVRTPCLSKHPENIFCRINTKLVSYRSFVPRMTCIDKSPPLVRPTPSTIKIGRRDWVTDINHVYHSSFTCLHQPETPLVLHSFFLLQYTHPLHVTQKHFRWSSQGANRMHCLKLCSNHLHYKWAYDYFGHIQPQLTLPFVKITELPKYNQHVFYHVNSVPS
jgi:hypothetical protein